VSEPREVPWELNCRSKPAEAMMKSVIMGRLSVMLTVVDDDDDAAIAASHFANQSEE